MALINTLRKRMGTIVVGLVAFSMIAFIGADLLQSNSSIFGGSQNKLAEIAGSTVTYQEFQKKVDYLSYVFAINQQRNPSSEELESIRQQAWLSFIQDEAYQDQFEDLGLKVTVEEIRDMVQGNNIDPQVRQFFANPETGEYDVARVKQILGQISTMPEQKAAFETFDNTLGPMRRVRKYDNLLELTSYVTRAEAKDMYEAQNSNMTIDYFYVPFFSVPDSAIQVTKEEMETYLENHEGEYQREESRSLNYVVFPIAPSAEDSAYIREEIASLSQRFRETENDSSFATINTDGIQPFQTIVDPGLVPEALLMDGKLADAGTVTDPIQIGNTYTLIKLSEVTEGDEYFVKARHILIESDGTSDAAKAEARKEAASLISQLRNGADFDELAAEHSADQSNAQNGGDLGWFGENGSMVESFKEPVFAFNGTGLIPRPIETSFGFHIVRIDEPKTRRVYKIAKIEKELVPSDETINEIYRQADLFAARSADEQSFVENAAAEGYRVQSAANVEKNASTLGTIQDARTVIFWLYNDASLDEVSDVKDLGDQYVVAVMTGIQEKGTASLSQVENEIRTKVAQEKKAEQILKKLAEVESDDFEAMKEAYGEGARTGEADLTLSSNSVPNIGFSPEAVGVAFSLNEGEKTKPFTIGNGVVIIRATAKSPAEEIEDYSSYVSQVENKRRTRKTVIANFPLTFSPLFVSQGVDEAIREAADIEDNRYKFF